MTENAECNEVELFLIMDFVTEFYSLKQQEKIEIPLLVDCVKYEIALEKYNRGISINRKSIGHYFSGSEYAICWRIAFLKKTGVELCPE